MRPLGRGAIVIALVATPMGCVNLLGDDFAKADAIEEEDDDDDDVVAQGSGGFGGSLPTVGHGGGTIFSGGAGVGGEGADDGFGGEPQGPAGSVTASSASTSVSSVSSSSSGPITTCDDQPTCETCQDCALTGACSDEANACVTHEDCMDLVDCLNACTNSTCDNGCFDAHPSGEAAYLTLALCVICDECFATCDGAGAGCP